MDIHMKVAYITIVVSVLISSFSFAQNTNTYQYDNNNRLSNSSNENSGFQYTFDELGNRLQYVIEAQTAQQTDLLVENISIPTSTISQGASLVVSCDVSNIGAANANGTYLKVYLANTSTGIDTELESKYVSEVTASGSVSLSFNITIPQDAIVGSMYLVFYADATTILSETDESNNKANIAVTIQAQTSPDLTVQNSLLSPISLLAGESTTMSADIMNIGNANASSFNFKSYLSLNPTFESYNDIELTDATSNIASLNAGATSAYNRSVGIPANTVPGVYYVLFVVDSENAITEQNKENNIAYATLTVNSQSSGGSLPVASFSADNQFIGAGTTIQFTDMSSDNPTSWQWTFAGGTPSSSTAQNPSVTYNTNGSYDVTLTTSNVNGYNTKTEVGFVNVGGGSEDWIWGKQITGTATSKGTAVDQSGNVYVVGEFTGTVQIGSYTLNSGLGTYKSTFVAKFDPEGVALMATAIGTQDYITCVGEDISIDVNGNILITGYIDTGEFSSTIDFGNGVTLPITNSDGYDIFLIKLNATGTPLWARNAICAGTSDNGKAISSDLAGNVYVAGYYYGTYSSPNTINFNGLIKPGEGHYANLFLAKYTASGSLSWVKTPQTFGSHDAVAKDMYIDEFHQKVHLIGDFSGTIIAGSGGSGTRTALGVRDVLLISYTFQGILAHLNNFGGLDSDFNEYECGHGITGKDGYQYITGGFSKTANFGVDTKVSLGYTDMFVAKIWNGAVLWINSAGSADPDKGYDISIDDNNKIKVLGYSYQNADFSGQILATNSKFISQYDANGNLENVLQLPGLNNENGSLCQSTIDNSIYVSDQLSTDYTFGSDALISGNGFVAKKGIVCPENVLTLENTGDTELCNSESITLSIPQSFDNYIWSTGEISQSITVNQSGNYYVNVSDANGCTGESDTLSVNVYDIPVATLTANSALTFCEGGEVELFAPTGADFTYKWLKNGEYITGEITTNYIATISGDYQVEISNPGNCQVLSNTITVIAEASVAYVSITASESTICESNEVTFTANPTNEGVSPQYQWQLNGSNVGTNSTTYTNSTLLDSDEITCILIASGTCIISNPVTSNTITITVNQTYLSETSEATICQGESYSFGTQTLSTAGEYTETFTSVSGCDSTVVLTLSVNLVYAETAIATICQGESYNFGTQTLIESGNYTESFTSVTGCDSTVVLSLIVNSVYSVTANAEICQGESYTFGTQTLTEAGIYSETFISENGCDSIVELTLNLSTVYNESAEAAICDGDTYNFGTQTLTNEGTYTQIFTSQMGCDSTVVLTLAVNPLPNANFSYATSGLDVSFTNNSQNAETYYWNFGDGNESTNENPVHTYTAANNYDVVLTATNNLCGSNDSIQTIGITTSVFNLDNEGFIRIFPNPTSGIVFLDSENINSNQILIEIVSINGQLVYKKEYSSLINEQIDLSGQVSGIYFIKIRTENEIRIMKILKE